MHITTLVHALPHFYNDLQYCIHMSLPHFYNDLQYCIHVHVEQWNRYWQGNVIHTHTHVIDTLLDYLLCYES